MNNSFKLKETRKGLPLIVILTAIKAEFIAVVTYLTNRFEEVGDHGTVYEDGDFNVPGGQSWKVAVVGCGAGNQGAASEVHLAINYFHPDVIFFVGVAGSLKEDIRLGHVVASTKVYCYHSGKSDSDFSPRPELSLSSYPLEQRARATARSDRWLQRLGNSQLNLETQPEAHVGPIAAGEQVVNIMPRRHRRRKR
jgi:nucleoside phosphorylase